MTNALIEPSPELLAILERALEDARIVTGIPTGHELLNEKHSSAPYIEALIKVRSL